MVGIMSEAKTTTLKEDEAGNKYKLNMPDECFIENVKSSIRRGLPQVQPHELSDQVIAIVGGGPSLKDSIEDLKEKHKNGMKVVSLNGTHDYLIENGIRPSVHVQVDGREFNARFVENWQEKTKYIIASQCHPKVFDNLKDAEVYIFHCPSEVVPQRILSEYYFGNYYQVPGGSTVMLRAIPLMRMLGFKKMEIYGFDSCIMDARHHAYIQEENDKGPVTTVTVNDKKFLCFAWMYSQAQDFIDMVKAVGDEFELIVHGDGLIAHILESSANDLEVD